MLASDKPIANPQVVLREEFDDWAVLFNPETSEALGVNPVGVSAWKRMDGSRTLRQIAVEIEEEFCELPDNAAEQLASFVEQLTRSGFIL